MTFTVIGSRCVNTISITAGIGCTFINIYTISISILLVAHITLASVARNSRYAPSIQTEIGMVLTDVYCLVENC